MNRKIFYQVIITIVLLILPAKPLFAAEAIILKSNDAVPYNQAIEGFKKIAPDVKEYSLNGESTISPELIKEIKNRHPKLIFALGASAAVNSKQSFPGIPIIYSLVLSPEDKGLTGENISGISIETSPAEQLLKLKSLLPKIKTVGVLYSHLTEKTIEDAEKISQSLGIKLVSLKVTNYKDVPDAAKKLIRKVDCLWLIPDSIIVDKNSFSYILLLTLENDIPFMVYNKNFVEAGALLSAVIDYGKIGYQAGKLGRQVIQGQSLPAAILPPEEIEWAINLRIAKKLGLVVDDNSLSSFKHIFR